MSAFSKLKAEFQRFDALPIPEKGEERKAIVRSIEKEIEGGTFVLTDDQYRQYRDGASSLGRICAYLYLEHGKIQSDLAGRRATVVSEWERLQRRPREPRHTANTSTMPLYYAARCYLTFLKGAPDTTGAQVDEKLFDQITKNLSERALDGGGQVRGVIEQIQSLAKKASAAHPTVVAAWITSRRAVLGAVIGALIGLIGTIIANWDKLSKRLISQDPAASSSTPAKK